MLSIIINCVAASSNDGDKIFNAVNKALKTKEGVEIEAKSTVTQNLFSIFDQNF